MKRVRSMYIWIVFFILLVVITTYTFWDNNRVMVVEQEIKLNHLPEELNGFTILQITDLHEKQFGKWQSTLLKEINSQQYDAIVFTGDMLMENDSTNFQPYFDIIDGLHNKEHALFVPGNSDPTPYKKYIRDNKVFYEKHAFYLEMENRGVKFLESLYSIKIGEHAIRFVDFEASLLTKNKQGEYVLEEFKDLENRREEDVLIALNHYPIVDDKVDYYKSHSTFDFKNYDLVIAGHYHGGQYRLPLIGAIFVPEAMYKWNGLFPPRDRVKGLWEYDGVKQYVSAGLGSSNTIPFMKFRLFNTPEINVLTIRRTTNGQ